MSLQGAPLLYVFYETASLPRQREFCERILGLPVIENQFHPPHEFHGLVKYDGGEIILSLNLSKARRFQKNASDGLITVLNVESAKAVQDRLQSHGYVHSGEIGDLFTDDYGHHYIFRSALNKSIETNTGGKPIVQELRLTASDLVSSLTFYRDVLELELLEQTENSARFATGTVDLLIQRGQMAPDGRPVRYHSYLLVFYTGNIIETRDKLVQRGLTRCPRVGSSDIGRTARFADPSGHTYCLYQPSEESLTWGSGPKVMEIAEGNSMGELSWPNGA